MLSPASQLLQKNASLFSQGQWLLANPEDAGIFNQLPGHADGFYQYFDVYQQSHGLAGQHQFGVQPIGNECYDGIVLYMPKSKAQAQMLIALLLPKLKIGGTFCLVGENKGGVKAAPKLMPEQCSQMQKYDAARHCSLFCCQLTAPVGEFSIRDWEQQFELVIGRQKLTICSLPGVFNHGSLDTGTALLLEHTHSVPTGKVLDFGCGAGIIGCLLAKLNPAIELVMSDVSALAVHCATRTAEQNAIHADIIAANGVTDLAGPFDAIYTNPPFHTGIHTDYSITDTFLSHMPRLLNPHAPLVLVANRFLPYQQALEQQFDQLNVKAQTTKFTLFEAR